jgi:hemicentin
MFLIGFGRPVVSTIPSNQVISVGDTALLYCNVTGYPNPTIKWTFNDKTIDGSDNQKLLRTDNSLAITNVQLDDDGFYRCHAENIAGYASDTTRLVVESYPKFLNLSTDTSAMGWQTVTLHCVLDRTVKPLATLTWYFNGKRLPDASLPRHQPIVDGRLVIVEVEGADSGLYACTARNNAGAISHSFALDVHVPVKIMSGPVNQQVVLGSAALFTCNVLGRPTPIIEWRINEVTVMESPGWYEMDDRHELLAIVKVKRSDDGLISCVASAGNQSMRANATLKVLVPPLVVQGVRDSVFMKRSTGILTCAVDGNPEPDIKWQKDDRDLPVNQRYRVTPGVSSTLTIDRLEVTDSGKYACIANSSMGSVFSSGTLEVQEAPVALGPPIVMEMVQRGKTVVLPCNTTGEPKPTIKWTPFPMSPRYIETEDGSLIILDAQPEDEGDFLCTAENSAGITNITMAWLGVTEFHFKPQISWCPRPYTTRIGQEARFECFAAGNPLPTIHWLHNGLMIESGMNGFDVTPDGTLTIAKVSQAHAGSVTCVAVNTAGVHSFETTLTVIVPPAFTKEPMDIRQSTGSDVLFQCSADGSPTPTIHWTKLPSQDLLPDNEEHYLQLEDGSLIIRNVNESDSGRYVCEAFSPFGRVMTSAELLIGSGSIDNGTQAMMNGTQAMTNGTHWHESMAVPEGQTVILHCIAASFPHAIYSWSFNGRSILEDSPNQFITIHRSLVITDVGYDADGAYTCTASNGMMNAHNTVHLKTLVPPDIYHSPHSQTLAWTFFEDSVDSAEFTCKASGFPVPTIYWTKDNRRLVGDRFTVNSTGHLNIKPLRLSDAGDYTCVAQNSAGVARETVSLLIQDNRPRDYCYPTLIYHRIRYKNCRTAQKVESYICEGHCFSQEYPGSVSPNTVQKFCCRVDQKIMRYVEATCSNGVTSRVLSPLVKKCTCAVCRGAGNIVLPYNEYR